MKSAWATPTKVVKDKQGDEEDNDDDKEEGGEAQGESFVDMLSKRDETVEDETKKLDMEEQAGERVRWQR